MTAAVLQRKTLQTLRVLDFCSERELGTQICTATWPRSSWIEP
jgi:hypothetical protein